MAAKIFSVPKEVKVPELNFNNFNLKDYNESIEKFITELTDHVKKLGYTGKYVGETVRFPVADGNAVYMVFNLKPLMLIHLPIGDAWQYEHIERLTAADITKKIEQQKALKELFNKKKAENNGK